MQRQRWVTHLDRPDPPVDVEGVARRAVGLERGQRRRRPRYDVRVGGEPDARPVQVVGDQPPVVVVRETRHEPGVAAEPGQGDGDVGRAAAGKGLFDPSSRFTMSTRDSPTTSTQSFGLALMSRV